MVTQLFSRSQNTILSSFKLFDRHRLGERAAGHRRHLENESASIRPKLGFWGLLRSGSPNLVSSSFSEPTVVVNELLVTGVTWKMKVLRSGPNSVFGGYRGRGARIWCPPPSPRPPSW
jgi:hypothetical protein